MPLTQSTRPEALVLLSPAPFPSTYHAVKAAYRSVISSVFKASQTAHRVHPSKSRRIIDVALPCRHLSISDDVPRAAAYDETQRLLASVYKLITVIAATQEIDVESTDGIDVRVILVSLSRGGEPPAIAEAGEGASAAVGAVVSLRTLATSNRDWTTVYVIESEEGERVAAEFSADAPAGTKVQRLRGGSGATGSTQDGIQQQDKSNARKHYSIAVGGTFDHLHIGHKLLLTMFAFMADNVTGKAERTLTIGITAGELLKNKKYAEELESWDVRQRSVWNFLLGILYFDASPSAVLGPADTVEGKDGVSGREVHYRLPGLVIKLVEIFDAFGPTITDEGISALVLSGETRAGGQAVNDKRREKGWPDLDLFEVDVLDADEGEETRKTGDEEIKQGFANKLSSTEIRRAQSERKAAARGRSSEA